MKLASKIIGVIAITLAFASCIVVVPPHRHHYHHHYYHGGYR